MGGIQNEGPTRSEDSSVSLFLQKRREIAYGVPSVVGQIFAGGKECLFTHFQVHLLDYDHLQYLYMYNLILPSAF